MSVTSPATTLDPPVVETLRDRFQRGVFWSVAAAVATSGFNFVLNIVVARMLRRVGFGEFGIVQTTIVTIANIAQLAMGFTATKFVAEFRSSDPARAGRVIHLCSIVSLVTGSLAALVLFFSAPAVAAYSLKAPQLSATLQLASVIVFFTVLTGYQMGALAGLESYRTLAVLGLASGAVSLAAAGTGAAVWGLNGAIGGLGAASAAQWLMFRWALGADCRRHGLVLSAGGLRAERPLLFSFALPAALVGLSSLPALWLSNTLLVRQSGFAQMALYTSAFSLRSLVFFVPSLFNRVSMSLLNNQRGLRKWDTYARLFKVNLMATTGMVVLAAAGVALIGVPLLSFFGKDFRSGFPILLVLLFAAVLETIGASLYQIVQAESRMWTSMFLIAIPRDTLIVVFAYLLCGKYGALGLAWAYTIGIAAAGITTSVIVARIGIAPRRRKKPG